MAFRPSHLQTLKRSYASMATTTASLKQARKIICIGRNYADHVKELNNTKPKQPFFFLKPTSSLLLPDSGPCIRPRGVDLHYEVELALIMGKELSDYDGKDEQVALNAIDAYAVSIDMTGRNLQNEAKKKGLPWSIAKGFDTFLPISNVFGKEVFEKGDPHEAELWLKVNGQVKQEDSTGLMLFRIPRILSDISRVMRLEKGDIVLTGTPKGVGSVQPGDIMTAGIRVGGKEIDAGRIDVTVEESTSSYEFAET